MLKSCDKKIKNKKILTNTETYFIENRVSESGSEVYTDPSFNPIRGTDSYKGFGIMRNWIHNNMQNFTK